MGYAVLCLMYLKFIIIDVSNLTAGLHHAVSEVTVQTPVDSSIVSSLAVVYHHLFTYGLLHVWGTSLGGRLAPGILLGFLRAGRF